MCPETLDDGASYVGTQYEEGELTCVQRLSEPSQALFSRFFLLPVVVESLPVEVKSRPVEKFDSRHTENI